MRCRARLDAQHRGPPSPSDARRGRCARGGGGGRRGAGQHDRERPGHRGRAARAGQRPSLCPPLHGSVAPRGQTGRGRDRSAARLSGNGRRCRGEAGCAGGGLDGWMGRDPALAGAGDCLRRAEHDQHDRRVADRARREPPGPGPPFSLWGRSGAVRSVPPRHTAPLPVRDGSGLCAALPRAGSGGQRSGRHRHGRGPHGSALGFRRL